MADVFTTNESLRQDLAQLEERFQSFIDSSNEAVFCYEPLSAIPTDWPPERQAHALLDARLVLCNDVYAATRGAQHRTALYGLDMRQLARGPIDRIVEMIVVLIRSGNRIDGMEVEQRDASGQIRYAMSKAHLIVRDGRIQRLWGILRDITAAKQVEKERADLERQLFQAQKMESLGLLAGGIAHDFNNLLLVISAQAEWLLSRASAPPSEGLREILAATHKAADLTRGLLAFARARSPDPTVFDVAELIGETVGMLRRVIPERIELVFDLDRDEAPALAVQADRGQIEQVLVNLSLNARDAIDEHGTITIGCERVELSAADVAGAPWLAAGPFVRIRVADTGHGIDETLRERIFEPFVTSKGLHGTGLGLAMVYGIAKKHGGRVRLVRSERGGGSEFEVLLPSSSAPPSEARRRISPEPPRTGHETVLLAEDNDLVRAALVRVLSEAGYRVLSARDGTEAISLFDAQAGAVDVAVLDGIMPGLDGDHVYRHLRTRRPGLPVVVISGHTSGTFEGDYFRREGIELLTKPFRSEVLLTQVREALNRR